MIETLTPRFDNVLILNSGEKIFPQELEDFYTKAAPVKLMCIFIVSGMYGVRRSKLLWAVIQPNLDEFREFGEVNLRFVLKERFDNASQGLPSYKRIKGFTVTLDELPVTDQGLIDRYEIKEIYEPRVIAGKEGALPVCGEPSKADQALIDSVNGHIILKCLKRLSGIRRPIILEDSLELDLGIDSLGRIELASSLESAFSADLKIEAIARSFSVKDLIGEVNEALVGANFVTTDKNELAKTQAQTTAAKVEQDKAALSRARNLLGESGEINVRRAAAEASLQASMPWRPTSLPAARIRSIWGRSSSGS